MRIAPVVKQLGDDRVRMLAYNGSIPGPTLRVHQGSEINVRVRNDADIETTVHWHGLRLDNRYDGVPYETQDPIPIGGEFTYRLRFPDPGVYWYHPHIREDYGLDMGLYGNIVVVPSEEDYWAPVNREVAVTLDDMLVEEGQIAPFHHAGPTFVAMGRFGNVMLTGGDTSLDLDVRAGEVVRLYLTNTANTRLFNVALPGARMKLVGGDSGRYEHETIVEEVLLAPSERASWTCCSTRRARSRWSTARPATPTRSAPSSSPTTQSSSRSSRVRAAPDHPRADRRTCTDRS